MNYNQLPIYEKKADIIRAIQNNKFIIISGETGCGKTTQIPKILLENFDINKKIGVTQPRRISAISVAKRVAQELKQNLGQVVGFEVRFLEQLSDQTKIKFMTEGILLKEFLSDKNLKQYDFLVIDEAHERGMNSDILLGLIKKVSNRNQNLKFIVMSATLETEKFVKFFKSISEQDKVCQIEISGRFHPIEIYNTQKPVKDYTDAMVNTILQIHFTEKTGDILAFLTGREEIEDMKNLLIKKIKKFENRFVKQPMIILPLYSALKFEDQQKVFQRYPNTRKIILSTNIAETAVTIDGVVYIIDSGFVKIKNYDPKNQFESLIVCPISRASAIQRAGRAGRSQSGKCYRLYTKDAYNDLDEYAIPEILRSDLLLVTLHLKALNIQDIYNFSLIDRPENIQIKNSLLTLQDLQALDDKQQITKFGKQLLEFPLDPFSSFCLLNLLQQDQQTQNDVVTIISLMNVDNLVFYRSLQKKEGAFDEFQKKFFVSDSDHLTKLNILYKYIETKNKVEFCRHYFLNKKNLDLCLQIRDQLMGLFIKLKLRDGEHFFNGVNPYKSRKNRSLQDILNDIKISYNFNKNKILSILRRAFFKKVAIMNDYGYYQIKDSQVKAKIHPESVIFHLKQKPKTVIFSQIVETTQIYINEVSISMDQLNCTYILYINYQNFLKIILNFNEKRTKKFLRIYSFKRNLT